MMKQKKQKGYSLIEMAVVLLFLGVFVAAASRYYSAELTKQKVDDTQVNAARVVLALKSYLGSNGAYPCPAPFDVNRNDPMYGMPTDCSDPEVGTGSVVVPGTCDGGVCIELSQRDIIEDTPDVLQEYPRIRRGTVPFRVLNLPEEVSYDGYGRRFSYALTEDLGVEEEFDALEGGITIVDQYDEHVIEPASSAHFLIVGHGRNGKGGYTSGGSVYEPCAGGGGALDLENCNTAANDKYVIMQRDLAGADYYDDYVLFSLASERPMWKVSNSNNYNIVDQAADGGLVTFDADPDVDEDESDYVLSVADDYYNDVYVAGNTAASLPGKVRIENLANKGEAFDAPFSPDLIAGSGMECPDPVNQIVVGIANGNVICQLRTEIGALCDDDEVMYGVDSNKRPLCTEKPVFCPTTPVTLCEGAAGEAELLLTQDKEGEEVTLGPVGSGNYRETYRCDDDGEWKKIDDSGSCSCTDVNESSGGLDCAGYYDYKPGYTGTYSANFQRICPVDDDDEVEEISSSTFLSDCACDPAYPSDVWQEACGTGFEPGFEIWERDWVCVSVTPPDGYWDSWTKTQSCICKDLDPYKKPKNCPTGTSYDVTQDTIDNEKPYEMWQSVCNADGDGHDATKIQPADYSEAAGCVCDPTQYQIDNIGCENAPEYEGGGEDSVGIWKNIRYWDCSTNDWGAWEPHPDNTCEAKQCEIIAAGQGDIVTTQTSPNKPGDSCICGSDPVPCVQSAGDAGLWESYDSCSCVQVN